MAIDPTGYDKALAQIQPGALSERQQRIAAGLAMLADGQSYRRAASVAQVPLSTLWEYANHARSIHERQTRMEDDVQVVAQLSCDVALIAGEAVRDSLINERDQWKPGDLVKAYGVATDKLIALGQRASAGDDSVSELAKLLSNSRVTVEPMGESDRALSVEAERIG